MHGTVIRSQFKDNHLTSSHFEHPLGDTLTRRILYETQQYGALRSDPTNGSDALFSMYLDRAIEDDKKMVEGWKSNADGILISVSLQITSHTSAYILKL